MVTKKVLTVLFFVSGLTSCGWLKNMNQGNYSGPETVIAGRSEIKIIATPENKFLPHTITARPGQFLKIKITNGLSSGPIAFVILKKDEDPIVNAYLGVQAGAVNEWAPPVEHSLSKSVLLPKDKSEVLELQLPSEPGLYSYISSYPGHVDHLKGTIRIEANETVLAEEED